ncbi:MAG: ribonuclease HI [Acidobacteria bacterium]|nr:ribonuclease HI [Acidobacteriota bacterium]
MPSEKVSKRIRYEKRVRIYSDGACSGNPGPGGWAAVLVYGGHKKEISGGEKLTTNNRMELTAAIRALQQLRESCGIDFHTDSEYLRRGITEWLQAWKGNNWRRTDKEPVKNRDLWEALDRQVARHQIRWYWVRGHSGDEWNERCDALAIAEIARVRNG